MEIDEEIEQCSKELMQCVYDLELDRAKLLVDRLSREKRAAVVNSRDRDGDTLLAVAISSRSFHLVKFLLEECDADTNMRSGICDNRLTPLGCAVHYDDLKIVKFLIEHGAEVNDIGSDDHETPVLIACEGIDINMVRCLVENGADIHLSDIDGTTCLMKSASKIDICQYLLELGASVNAVDKYGETALFKAIKRGSLDTVRLLIDHGADTSLCSDSGDDILQYTALHGHADIVEYFIRELKPTAQRWADAYSLLGAYLVGYNADEALAFWIKAVNIRIQELTADQAKEVSVEPNPVYNNAVEARSTETLAAIASNVDAMQMQGLVVRERILGLAHGTTIKGLYGCATYYRNRGANDRFIAIAKYAFQKNFSKVLDFNIFPELVLWFCETFNKDAANVHFADVFELLEVTVAGIKQETLRSVNDFWPMTLQSLIHLVHLAFCLVPNDEERSSIHQLVQAVVQTRCRTKDGYTLLHLAIDPASSFICDDEWCSDLPNSAIVEALLMAGASVDSMDVDRNTPLHVAVLNKSEISRQDVWLQVIKLLLQYGAHVDFANANGKIASDMLPSTINVFNYLSLECLAARAVRKHQLSYRGIVPANVADLVNRH